MYSSKIILLSSFWLLAWNINGQDIEIQLSADTILIGNKIKVTYTLENLPDAFTEPSFENCEVMGPSVSSRYQSINGEVSQSESYTYYLVPKEEGLFRIPGISATTDDSEYTSENLQVYVAPNPDNIIQDPELNNENPFGQFFFDSPFKRETQVPELEEEDSIFKSKKKRKRRKI
jgi:hypothetical protein